MMDGLRGQHGPEVIESGPKAVDAARVREANLPGLWVPDHFNEVADAVAYTRAGHGSVIVRSNHPGEEDPSYSGLFESIVLTEDVLRLADQEIRELTRGIAEEVELWLYNRDQRSHNALVMAKMVLASALDVPDDSTRTIERLAKIEQGRDKVVTHAALLRVAAPTITDRLGYTACELIDGTNVTVIRDDANEDVYHIFACRTNIISGRTTYSSGQIVREDGEILYSSIHKAPGEPDFELPSNLIPLYGVLDDLFGSGNNCSVREFQVDRTNRNYFLQTLEGRECRSRQQPLDTKDFSKKEGWQSCSLVRGVLPHCNLDMVLNYPQGFGTEDSGFKLPDEEDASADRFWGITLETILARRRKLTVVSDHRSLYRGMAQGHGGRAGWFNSLAAFGLGADQWNYLVSPVLRERSIRASLSGRVASLAIQAASDGEKGYLRRNPDDLDLKVTSPPQAT